VISDEYFAGLFDGEGTIGLYRKNNSRAFRMPQMTLPSTTIGLLEALQTKYGGYIYSKGTKQKAHHRDSWVWSCQSNRVIEVCQKLYPHILEPCKKYRMNLLLTKYKEVTPRNGKYTEEMLAAKQQFELDFFAMEPRGGSADGIIHKFEKQKVNR